MNNENKNDAQKFQAGTIVTIPAVKDCPDFIVLESNDGNARCITRQTVDQTQFAQDRRIMYSDKECALRAGIDRWLTKLANNGLNLSKICEIEVFPSAWTRADCEEKIKAQAWAITLDEYCYYRKKVPAIMEVNEEWWLRTQDYSEYRYCVDEYGNIGGYPPEAIKGVRPSIIVKEDVLTEVRDEAK